MEGISEMDKFDRDPDEDMGEEEEVDPAAIEPRTTKLERSDLKKNVLNALLTEAMEAVMKAAAEKGEHDMVTKCLSHFETSVKDCQFLGQRMTQWKHWRPG